MRDTRIGDFIARLIVGIFGGAVFAFIATFVFIGILNISSDNLILAIFVFSGVIFLLFYMTATRPSVYDFDEAKIILLYPEDDEEIPEDE